MVSLIIDRQMCALTRAVANPSALRIPARSGALRGARSRRVAYWMNAGTTTSREAPLTTRLRYQTVRAGTTTTGPASRPSTLPSRCLDADGLASVAYTETGLPLFRDIGDGLRVMGAYNGTGNVVGALLGRAAAQLAMRDESAIAAPFLD